LTSGSEAATLTIRHCGLLFILAMSRSMVLAIRDVFGEQHEALTYLQERQALGRVTRFLGGIRTSVGLTQILVSRRHSQSPCQFVQQTAE
jgi:hypothetical protein